MLPSKIITLRAYFYKCDDKYKKTTMLFIDNEKEAFTKSFLTRLYSPFQTNPINKDLSEFYVKFDDLKSLAYLDKAKVVRTPIQALLDKHVEISVKISHYNFVDKKTGKKIIGWNMFLLDVKPI